MQPSNMRNVNGALQPAGAGGNAGGCVAGRVLDPRLHLLTLTWSGLVGVMNRIVPPHRSAEDFEFRSTRRSFATCLEAHGVSANHADRLLGHSGQPVRRKHYSAGDLDALARAVYKIHLGPPDGLQTRRPCDDEGGQGPESEVETATCSNQALVAQWIEQRFPKPLVVRSTRAGGAPEIRMFLADFPLVPEAGRGQNGTGQDTKVASQRKLRGNKNGV